MAHVVNNFDDISVQLDLAAFPGHDLRDVEDFISVDVDLGTDQDNGSCTVTCASVQTAAVERVRLYVYVAGELLFNGEIVGLGWNVSENDRTFVMRGRDAMARLRNKWTKEDRVYTSATEQSVIQNLVEASGIDASLTSIAGTSWMIGVAQEIVLHGGVADILTGDPGQSDVPLDLIKKIDESTPLWVTFSDREGVVVRRARELTSPVEYFTTGTIGSDVPCWDVTVERSADEVVNACKVIGLQVAGLPLESLYQAASAYVFDPPEFITEEINSPLIEDGTQADAVSLAVVTYKNGRKMTVSFTTALTTAVNPGDTVSIVDTWAGLNTSIFVTKVRYSIGADDATTTITGEVYIAD